MKKILFLLFFLGLLAGGGAYLYFTDFNLIKKYITPRIPETIMSKIPEKVKNFLNKFYEKFEFNFQIFEFVHPINGQLFLSNE